MSRSGIINTGNNCYINATLQCLSVSPFILEFINKYLTQDKQIFEVIKKYNFGSFKSNEIGEECNKILNGGLEILEEDRTILEKIKNNCADIFIYISFKDIINNLINRKDSVLSNNVFLKILVELTNGTGFEYLVNGEQNDPHEFMAYLFDKIHNSKSQRVNIGLPSNIDDLSDIHKLYLKHFKSRYEKDYSHFVKNFYYYIINCVECTKCNYKSYELSPNDIMCVSIPDIDINNITLEDCITNMFNVENIGYKCEKCNNEDNNRIQKKILSKPKTLIIKIKRYATIRNMLFKVSKMVNYPKILNLLPYFCGNDLQTYELYGIINHVGMLNSGHYYSYIREPNSSNGTFGDKWYCCNDSRVNEISNDEAMNSNNAYILFYHSNNQ
jgi:ubiquitin C-terminal hydrolase